MRSRAALPLVCLVLLAAISLVACAPGGDEATPIEIPGEDVTGDEANPIEIPDEEPSGEAEPKDEEDDGVQPATPIEIPGDEVTDE